MRICDLEFSVKIGFLRRTFGGNREKTDKATPVSHIVSNRNCCHGLWIVPIYIMNYD